MNKAFWKRTKMSNFWLKLKNSTIQSCNYNILDWWMICWQSWGKSLMKTTGNQRRLSMRVFSETSSAFLNHSNQRSDLPQIWQNRPKQRLMRVRKARRRRTKSEWGPLANSRILITAKFSNSLETRTLFQTDSANCPSSVSTTKRR